MNNDEKASQDDPPEKEGTIDEEVKHLVERLRQRVQRRKKRRRDNAEEQEFDGFSLSLSGRIDNLNEESLNYVFNFIANESEGQISSLSFLGVWIQPKPLQSLVQVLLDHQKCASIESLAFYDSLTGMQSVNSILQVLSGNSNPFVKHAAFQFKFKELHQDRQIGKALGDRLRRNASLHP